MGNSLTCCWRPLAERGSGCRGATASASGGGGSSSRGVDGLWWYQDLGKHGHGEFSMAVVQANSILEDHSQLESGPMSLDADMGPHGTFVGIYDGHGGPQTSQFVNHHLFDNIKKFASDKQQMSTDVIKSAYLETEEEFLSFVRTQWETAPQMATVGSCCLVGIICCGVLYVANAGDSRVVLGKLHRGDKWVEAVQLSDEHNANLESVREDLRSLHPHDPQIVVFRHQVWRVKGIIQVSRSIGDAYLKNSEFNKPPLLPKFQIPEPFQKPILLAEPSMLVQKLYPEDLFLIFASDGLWEHLTNQDAVELVYSSPRVGIARKLVEAAMRQAAKKREIRYSDLARMECGVRRYFHDDITVIVLYLDSHLINQTSSGRPIISVKGGSGF